MAHNLNEINGKVSFASTQKAWHGLGQIVEKAMTSKEAIELGGLGYTVEKSPVIMTLNDQAIEVPEKFVTYRTDTNTPLGVVGSRYQVLQNVDAFNFFDAIVEEGNAIFETAGALGKGEKVFISAKMPDYIRIDGTDDLTEVYVLLTNSHDGSGTVTAMITPVRVVCQNTLNAALKRGFVNKLNLRHTNNVKFNLQQAHRLMGISNSYTQEMNEVFNSLAKKSVTDAFVKDLIKDLFKTENEDSTRIKNIQEAVFASYAGGIGQDKIIGSAWGAFNGITHYLDHEKSYKNAESKLLNLTEGVSYKIANEALNKLVLI